MLPERTISIFIRRLINISIALRNSKVNVALVPVKRYKLALALLKLANANFNRYTFLLYRETVLPLTSEINIYDKRIIKSLI